MPIPFTCPYCGRFTEVEDRFAGQQGPCAECGLTITIPALTTGRVEGKRRWIAGRENAALLTTAVTALVAFVLVLALAAYRYLPGLLGPPTPQRQLTQCHDNLRQIALALLAYEAEHGEFPPAVVRDENGKPLHSWRTLLLPYLGPEATSIYAQFHQDVAWDDPINLPATQNFSMPAVYRCPADVNSTSGDTSYLLITGPGTIYDGVQPATSDRAAQGDGTGQTIVVVECHGSGIAWAEPRDMDIVQLARGVNSGAARTLGSSHVRRALAVTIDGTVLELPDSINGIELRRLATFAGGERNSDAQRWAMP